MDDRDWATVLRDLRNVDNVAATVAACQRLHHSSGAEDVPRLRELLQDSSFLVREAAAWPLSELVGAAALPELFGAYQRGVDEGHDNDGFSTVLLEMAAADPQGVREVLARLGQSDDRTIREHAAWLMEFCVSERDA